MASSALEGLSTDDQEALRHLSGLLHLFNHRNHNQHRRSIWWRAFSTFRRQLNALLDDFAALQEKPTTHLARAKKKIEDPRRRKRIDQRLLFWRETLVTKWHHAFSQVVSDGRFAVLGVVLIAVLAQVCRLVGITAELERLGQEEVEKVLEQFGKEDWGLDDTVRQQGEPVKEDLGEIVMRETLSRELPKSATSAATRTPIETQALEKKRQHPPDTSINRLKKKKKKGNAIDDLFSGL